MRPHHWLFLAVPGALALGAASCGQLPEDGSVSQSAIVGGTADTVDTAVMALVHQTSNTMSEACSGTTIATVGASGIYLTAAHCVVLNDATGKPLMPPQVADPSNVFILPGPDWMASFNASQYYGVSQIAVHPSYDGTVNSPFDVALVRYLGALPTTPIIPAMTAAEDKLAVGTSMTVIGFGKTLTNDMNSVRFEVARSIDSLTSNQFTYTQTDNKGACEGDSGGPDIVQTADGARVAGITSFGDPTCTMVGASVRISPVASFIASFIASAPKTLSCDDCSLASVGPGNACINQGIVCGQATSPCGKFLACANACPSGACVTQCGRSNPTGETQYNDVVSCQCGGMCQAACASNQACGGSGTGAAGSAGTGTGGATGTAGSSGASGAAGATGGAGTVGGTGAAGSGPIGCGLSDPRSACESCIQNSCCTQASACGADVSCAGCLADPTAAACAASFAFKQLNTCLAGCSGSPCSGASPTPTPDAGTSTGVGGAGGSGTAASGGKSGCGCDVSPASESSSLASIGAALGLATLLARARRRIRR